MFCAILEGATGWSSVAPEYLGGAQVWGIWFWLQLCPHCGVTAAHTSCPPPSPGLLSHRAGRSTVPASVTSQGRCKQRKMRCKKALKSSLDRSCQTNYQLPISQPLPTPQSFRTEGVGGEGRGDMQGEFQPPLSPGKAHSFSQSPFLS